VAHGLNVKPSAMRSLTDWFNSQGCDSILVKFSGHYEDPFNNSDMSAEAWRQDMVNGYEAATSLARQHNMPLFFLGYSLGALLGMDLVLSTGNDNAIVKQVLLAPAIAIRNTASILKLLFWWNSLSLPSFTPAKYRANKKLSIIAYKSMFSIEAGISHSNRQTSIPTLAVIDNMDELISTKKLDTFLDRFIGGHYELLSLDTEMKNREGGYHHLIINKETMGEVNWRLFTEKMKSFLFG
jgi:esterase/lipase